MKRRYWLLLIMLTFSGFFLIQMQGNTQVESVVPELGIKGMVSEESLEKEGLIVDQNINLSLVNTLRDEQLQDLFFFRARPTEDTKIYLIGTGIKQEVNFNPETDETTYLGRTPVYVIFANNLEQYSHSLEEMLEVNALIYMAESGEQLSTKIISKKDLQYFGKPLREVKLDIGKK
jgi:hypothetical protein